MPAKLKYVTKTDTASGDPVELQASEQKFEVTDQNGRRIYLLFGGRRADGTANNFAKKHLLSNAKYQKRLAVAMKRTHINTYNQDRKDKLDRLDSTAGVKYAPMGANPTAKNTCIRIGMLSMQELKGAFADAVGTLADGDDQEVTVRFLDDCVYTTSSAGQEKGPYRKARVAVKRVGDVYEVYHCAGHVP